MLDDISRSYEGPKDGSPLLPPWVCQTCGANLENGKCPNECDPDQESETLYGGNQYPNKYIVLCSYENNWSAQATEVTDKEISKEYDKYRLKIGESRTISINNGDFGLTYKIVVRVL
jgi:hypothetical protein